uniref:Pentatricopeptide repeat-containing protein n=1 Tax=Salix viminalis TaxID=40686 RepID=A0A6N2KXC1_SALVM
MPIQGFLERKCKSVVKAEELFLEMKGAGICPDVVVCGSLMHGLCSMCEWEEAKDQGVWPNMETCNVLVHMLCKSGKVKEIRELFELMAQRDGYCLSGMIDDGRELFVSMVNKGINIMLDEGIRPTIIIHNTFLGGSFQGSREARNCLGPILKNVKAKWKICHWKWRGKKGCAPNVVAFNMLMHGFFQNNETQKAIDFNHKMKVRKLSPDASTVSMFNHIGKLDEKTQLHSGNQMIVKFVEQWRIQELPLVAIISNQVVSKFPHCTSITLISACRECDVSSAFGEYCRRWKQQLMLQERELLQNHSVFPVWFGKQQPGEE